MVVFSYSRADGRAKSGANSGANSGAPRPQQLVISRFLVRVPEPQGLPIGPLDASVNNQQSFLEQPFKNINTKKAWAGDAFFKIF